MSTLSPLTDRLVTLLLRAKAATVKLRLSCTASSVRRLLPASTETPTAPAASSFLSSAPSTEAQLAVTEPKPATFSPTVTAKLLPLSVTV